jgi:hypothetical protein
MSKISGVGLLLIAAANFSRERCCKARLGQGRGIVAGAEAVAYSEILSGYEELADFCKGNAVLLHNRQLQRAHLREKIQCGWREKTSRATRNFLDIISAGKSS